MALKNFRPNAAGFKQLAVSSEVRGALKEVVEKGKTIAEGLSEDFRITGEYAESFETVETTIDHAGQYPGPRAAAQLVNTSPHAAAVEYGNAHAHKPHRVLGRTLDALGSGHA